MRFLLVPPHPHRARRLALPTAIVKKFRVTAQSALPNSSPKQRILYGVALRVEITCTKTASSSGPRAKPGKRFDVFIGMIVLDAVETFILMRFQPYAMAGRRGIAQAGQEGRESQ